MKSFIIFSIFILCTIHGARAQCQAVSCVGQEAGTYIADPLSCNKYYLCLQNETVSDTEFKCESGNHFDGTGCSRNSADFRCQVSCPPVPCNTNCTRDFEHVPISNNCLQYDVCIPVLGDWDKEPVDCSDPIKPYYDSQLNVCDTTPIRCCHNDFSYCYIPYVQIPYPDDCTKFYLCMNVGVPNEEDLNDCADDEWFNPSESKCEIGTCIN